MTKDRKAQIAWWASKVYEQAEMYADIADPKRARQNSIANRLDAIASACQMIHHEITGKLPGRKIGPNLVQMADKSS